MAVDMSISASSSSLVFISYSHENDEHSKRVLAFADRLRSLGVDAIIDQYVPFPAEGWPLWCERQVKSAKFVLLVCTETFRRRFDMEEILGGGLGVIMESVVARQILYDEAGLNHKFVPVLFSDGSEDNIPLRVRGASRFRIETETGFDMLFRLLTDQPATPPLPLGPLVVRPPIVRSEGETRAQDTASSGESKRQSEVIKFGVPQKPYGQFVGRRDLISEIVTVLKNSDGLPIIVIKAMGGMGKTALAFRIVDECLACDAFDAYIWHSTQIERFAEEGRLKVGEANFSFGDLLNKIGIAFRNTNVERENELDKKTIAVKEMLSKRKTLFILDNLETIEEKQRSEVIDMLYQILGLGKILITCRHRILHDRALTKELPGLLGMEGLYFIKNEIEDRRIETATEVAHGDLNEIVVATGGSPLTISVIVGQLKFKSPSAILTRIRSVVNKNDSVYEEIYRYMYRDSLKLIDEFTQNVLISMASLIPMIGAEESDIAELYRMGAEESDGDETDRNFDPTMVFAALKDLYAFSLVILLRGQTSARYALHPLTFNLLYIDLGYLTGR